MAFVVILGLGLSQPAHAELTGLDYSVSGSGDAVTIDGETFAVSAVPKKEWDGEYGWLARLGRGLALDGRTDKLVSCSAMWSYEADYGFSPPILGANCVVEHDGMQENAVLCDSVFTLNAMSYWGQKVPSRRDIVLYATRMCGGHEIKIIHEYDTPEIANDLDRRPIQDASEADVREAFSDVMDIGTINSCELGVALPVPVGGGNVSTGAVCQVKDDGQVKRLELCTDEAIGHFKKRDIGDHAVTKEQLAVFTIAYCSAG